MSQVQTKTSLCISFALLCIVASGPLAAEEGCDEVESVITAMETDPSSLTAGPDARMNEDREADDFFYFLPSRSLPGASSCKFYVDANHTSVPSAMEMTYKCEWKKSDGSAALDEVESLANSVAECLSETFRPREYQGARSASHSYYLFRDRQTSRGVARQRIVVAGRMSLTGGNGYVLLSVGMDYTGKGGEGTDEDD